ncbi:MAG: sulfotransferase [Nitrososphaera sp.]|nr:sulfotransferase [Nitrososphaera sp.]
MQHSIIITGVPRGGTTFLGYLINNLENAYCLSEPACIDNAVYHSNTPEEFLRCIRGFLAEQRSGILSTGRTLNRVGKDGCALTNYFIRARDGRVVPQYQEADEEVHVRDERFVLGVKHNAHFLSVLPHLCKAPEFRVLAILRHPVPVILSWRSLDLPISHGRLPAGERFWPLLAQITQSDDEILLKQVMIYEAIATRLVDFREHLCLLSYEDLVRNPHQVCELFDQRFKSSVACDNHSKSAEYDWNDAAELKSLLLKYAPTALTLYPDLEDVDKGISNDLVKNSIFQKINRRLLS